jgi:hypothetical protein
MKLKYIRLSDKGMQVVNGRLRQDLTSDHFSLTLISNLRCVKVSAPEWPAAIYIPVERLDNFSPADEAAIK